MMNMDELSPSEIMQIDGAGWTSSMAEFVDTGSVIGTVIGYATIRDPDWCRSRRAYWSGWWIFCGIRLGDWNIDS